MELIDDFIDEYRNEYDFYIKLSYIAQEIIEDTLKKNEIKAIISSRAKKPVSLREKIIKRNVDKKYKNIEEIRNDIFDFSGVRISLYFPSERENVDRIIKEDFCVAMGKSFPEKGRGGKKGKSNPGYWANHYRVYLKDENYSNKFRKTPVEIQVTSVLMHSWAEIEHDLVYKPKNGKLSWKEHKILAGLNALIIAGEIALEKLQTAISERISARKTRDDKNNIKTLPKPDQA